MMKLMTLTIGFAIVGASALGAQTGTTTTKTTVEIKGGKSVKVTGCVEADPAGGFALTHVADKGGAMHSYVLVTDGDELSKVVGQRVQIEGRIADSEHGKVKIKSETEGGGGKDTQSKLEGRGPYLGVKQLKKIAAACP